MLTKGFTPQFAGLYSYVIFANDSLGNANVSPQGIFEVHNVQVPETSNFTSAETTDFLLVPDIANVTNLTLASSYGKISFPADRSVNASNEQYDQYVKIMPGFISVDAINLHPSFNISTTLYFYNVSCPTNIYVSQGAPNNREEVLEQGTVCDATSEPSCTNIICEDDVLSFTAEHFTGYAFGSTENLTIWDQKDTGMPYINNSKSIGDNIFFFANYSNTSGVITGAQCNITYHDLSYALMTYNSTLGAYTYNRSYSAEGTYYWNVTCNMTGFNTLQVNDTITLSSVEINNLFLNATSLFNISADNLTCNYNLAGTATTAAVAWYKNDAPIMLLYLPFEGNNSNALSDYSGSAHTSV